MDISQNSNVIELKAIAYDILRERNNLSEDLEKVTLRIFQLEQSKLKKADSEQEVVLDNE